MDRSVKATLWVTALAILSYAILAWTDCAMDPSCHIRFCGPRGAPCGMQRIAPKSGAQAIPTISASLGPACTTSPTDLFISARATGDT